MRGRTNKTGSQGRPMTNKARPTSLTAPLYRLYERRLLHQLDPDRLPRHIGIILDGHRRHARAEGLETYSHSYRSGMRRFEEFLGWGGRVAHPVRHRLGPVHREPGPGRRSRSSPTSTR